MKSRKNIWTYALILAYINFFFAFSAKLDVLVVTDRAKVELNHFIWKCKYLFDKCWPFFCGVHFLDNESYELHFKSIQESAMFKLCTKWSPLESKTDESQIRSIFLKCAHENMTRSI